MAGRAREHFVQCAAREPTLQGSVGPGMAERRFCAGFPHIGDSGHAPQRSEVFRGNTHKILDMFLFRSSMWTEADRSQDGPIRPIHPRERL